MIDLDREDQAIELIKEFADIPDIYTDKHNVIQILNNLVSNAKHALRDMDRKAVIKVKTVLDEENKMVRIEVSDNGCGIPPEVQRNIFQFGFTTKESGHGFGLHMSANAAKVMEAKLVFSSEGIGKGSIFTLEIPFITDATVRPDKEGIAA
jgi:signal transduction histidine kinase